MKIRSATINDIPDIINIYDEQISIEEKGAGKTGWIRGIYPTKDNARDALDAETIIDNILCFIHHNDAYIDVISSDSQLIENDIPHRVRFFNLSEI